MIQKQLSDGSEMQEKEALKCVALYEWMNERRKERMAGWRAR